MDPTEKERIDSGNFLLMCKMKESNSVCAFKMCGINDPKLIEEAMSYLFAACDGISKTILSIN